MHELRRTGPEVGTAEQDRSHDGRVVPRVPACNVCGRPLSVRYEGTEGGMKEAYICALHGTRGLSVSDPKNPGEKS